MNRFDIISLAATSLISLVDPSPHDEALAAAKPVLEAFSAAVSACDRSPPFQPGLEISSTAGATRYDAATRTIVLVSYESLGSDRRAAMERFAAIGTLGLSGRGQYVEIFNTLLVAHELGHWVQDISRRPLNRWQAESEANRMMVAFWREHPSAVSTELRLANFVVQGHQTPDTMPRDAGTSTQDFFNANLARIEADPMQYALFQKAMVRTAMTETPLPTFCETIRQAWP